LIHLEPTSSFHQSAQLREGACATEGANGDMYDMTDESSLKS
jgi:hypothetical protein